MTFSDANRETVNDLYNISKINDNLYMMYDKKESSKIVRVEHDTVKRIVLINYFENNKGYKVTDEIYNRAMELAEEVFSNNFYKDTK